MSTEPIILNTAEERELWQYTYRTLLPSRLMLDAIDAADAAVRELRARMPAAQVQPTYPPGEEPRVVECGNGWWLIVRGASGLEWWSFAWNSWQLADVLPAVGNHRTKESAESRLASLTPAQLAAAVGVECK